MRATGTFRCSSREIGTDIEITAKGDIVARIPGQEMEVRGMLCSPSTLTNMLLMGDAKKTDI